MCVCVDLYEWPMTFQGVSPFALLSPHGSTQRTDERHPEWATTPDFLVGSRAIDPCPRLVPTELYPQALSGYFKQMFSGLRI